MQSAAQIYQLWLDEIARLLWDGDHAAVAERMTYPHVMATRDGSVHFDAPDQMAEASADFRKTLTRLGATAFHRICKEAEFVAGGDRIEGTHTTYILRGGSFAVPPYSNRMTLQLQAGAWRGAGMTSDVNTRDVSVLSPAQLAAQHRADPRHAARPTGDATHRGEA